MDARAKGLLRTWARNTVGGGEDVVSGSEEEKKEGCGITMKIPFLWNATLNSLQGFDRDWPTLTVANPTRPFSNARYFENLEGLPS
jgi:hypothetical protein